MATAKNITKKEKNIAKRIGEMVNEMTNEEQQRILGISEGILIAKAYMKGAQNAGAH